MRRACLVPIIALIGACGAQDFPFDSPDAGAEAGVEAGTEAATMAGCSRDRDCPLRSQRCDVASGQCVACVTDVDCATAGHPFCDSMLHQCVECEVDVNCPGGFCEPTTHRCVFSCADAGSCPDFYQICTLNRVCVDCRTSADCVGARAGPWCAVAVGQCVQCLARDQCTQDRLPLCNTATNRCVECLSNRDCSSGEACEPQSHSCVDVGGSGFYDGGANDFPDGGVYVLFEAGVDSSFH